MEPGPLRNLFSPFAHAGVSVLMGLPFLLLGMPIAGAAFGIAYYLGREGRDAQAHDPRSKGEDWAVPFTPWTWPRQSQLDTLGPILAWAAILTAAWVGVL